MYIEKLTPEQELLLIKKRDEWIAIGRSCGETNREAARKHIEDGYRAAGKEPPKEWIFLKGPLEAAAKLDELAGKKNGENWHWPNFYGSQDGYYWSLAWYETMKELGVEGIEPLDPWFAASRVCGWCWLYWDVAIITDRPLQLHVDVQGRLHNETGPAVEYADGLKVFAWHGVRIPEEWITDKANLKVETALTFPNLEQRRAAAEIIGWERVLAELPLKVIDTDADPMVGMLFSVRLPDTDKDTHFLKVLCGTGRTFVLVADENAKTALEANAQFSNVPPEVYRLLKVRT